MEAKNITDSIQAAIDKNKIQEVQKGDLKILIEDYSEILSDYKKLSISDRDSLFEDVRKKRPMIGRKLKEQLDSDISEK